ncbi:calcium-binding protein [Leptothoe spongobia]|uniref:Calcium-binding protein n=1 Tax=Leptothoe spongobia TAU-MAC 1115 TaxID=1967444 RepID=A0A947DG66_9CYAN|nr:calcium-binding protein [Leptothoe spongobia]MBT9316463.1 hypothetical protein [Leptothoe spongobia TAU-MAC 1115]
MDTLNGGNGVDILDGGLGRDIMNGGDGNDTYFVNTSGDIVRESFDDTLGGTSDIVFASVSYSLSPGTFGNQGFGIENLTLTGTGNLRGTGNSQDNIITGNIGNNVLEGANGNDYLFSSEGNDTLNGGLGEDILIGGSGDDVLDGDGGRRGFGEKDILTGDSVTSEPDARDSFDGADLFILGNGFGAYYVGDGDSGYATITDFYWNEGDKFQVFGVQDDYTLGFANVSGSSALDTVISYKGDRIGVVEDTIGVELAFDFNFVGF